MTTLEDVAKKRAEPSAEAAAAAEFVRLADRAGQITQTVHQTAWKPH